MITIFYVDVIIYAVKSNVSIIETPRSIYNWTKVNNKHILGRDVYIVVISFTIFSLDKITLFQFQHRINTRYIAY